MQEKRLFIPQFDDDEPLEHCILCGNTQHDDDALYCQECGEFFHRYNICENRNCHGRYDDEQDVVVRKSAKFCPFCGEPTLFSRLELFEPQ